MATITGNNSANTLNGTTSADDIYGLNGADTINANAGNDSLFGGTGNDVLNGDAGNDTLFGDDGADTLNGGLDDDQLFGGIGNDRLFGGDGNDTIAGDAGTDSLVGGAGFDMLSYATSNAAVTVNLLANTVTGGHATGDTIASVEGITGSAFADQLFGSDISGADTGANLLIGGDGADTISGRSGADTITGDAGADSILGGHDNDSLSGGADADTILGGEGDDTVDGGTGADLISGDADQTGSWAYSIYDRDFTADPGQAFTIESGTLIAQSTTSTFDVRALVQTARGTTAEPEDFGIILTSTYTAGAAGTYRFTTTSDDGSTLRILDANGNPLTFTNETGSTTGFLDNDYHQAATTRWGDVTLVAGQSYTIEIRMWENAGDQILDATVTPPGGTSQSLAGNASIGSATYTGNDSLTGGAGNDTIHGNAGNDTLAGGDDTDQLFGGAGADNLAGNAGIDSLEGGDGNDTLDGGTEADSLYGGNDADLMFGGAGNDGLYGGLGNDTLTGGAGADILTAGQGMDYADYTGSGSGVTLDLTSGAGVGGDAAGDTLAGIDGVFGSAFGDLITGYDGASTAPDDPYTNVFYGNAGNDTLQGLGGGDALFGGDDNDLSYGGGGDDTLTGDAGADQLFGGDGSDALAGGTGNDSLFGGAGADTLSGGDDADYLGLTGLGDVIDGGEGGADQDTLDLTDWGKALTNVLFGGGNDESGTVQFLDTGGAVIGSMSFANIETVIPCFTPGCLVQTALGPRAVEMLKAGDLVMTRDNGLQPIQWVGLRNLTVADLIVRPNLCPIRFNAGALGQGVPQRDMMVSPQHRMLMEGARAALFFGEEEVLVAATHLTNCPGIAQVCPAGVTYIHLMFARHEIICVDGAWSESFQPGAQVMAGMQDDQRAEIVTLFPDLADVLAFPAARRSLRAHEARVLLAA